MKPKDFINGKVTYDNMGQYFFIHQPNTGLQMLAELRGWGAIQNRFRKPDGMIDMEEAAKFQDEIGQWVADAINEKLEREK